MKTIAAQKTSEAPLFGRIRRACNRCDSPRVRDLHLFRATPAQFDDRAILVVYESFSQQQARRRMQLAQGTGSKSWEEDSQLLLVEQLGHVKQRRRNG